MDHCASVLLRFPPSGEAPGSLSDDVFDQKIKIHIGRVQKLFKDSPGLVAAHSIELLNCLNPAIHTYSYLTLLDSVLPADASLYDSVEPVVADKVLSLLATFDTRQVRYAGSAFTHLFTAAGSGRIIPPSVAVPLLAGALETLSPTGSMLTSNHLTLAKLAYHTGHAAAALPVLGKDIVFYPGMTTTYHEPQQLCSLSLAPPSYISKDTGLTLPLRSTQVLEFDHLVGLLHCAVRDWAAAHAAFARVVACPTRENGVSKIMAEAHKKWILTGLLVHGQVAAVPPMTAAYARKVCTTINKLYLQIADHFADADAEGGLMAEVALGAAAAAFGSDGTAGLVQAVLAAHPKWQIAQLRSVYTKVPLSAVRTAIARSPPSARATSDAEIEALLQDMIDSGMIRAAIRRGGAPTTTAASTTTAAPTEAAAATTTTTTSAAAPTSEPTKPTEAPAASSSPPQPSATTTTTYLEFLPEVEELAEAEFAEAMVAAAARMCALRPLYKTTDEHLSLNRDFIRQMIHEQKNKDAKEREGGLGGGGAGMTASMMYGDDLEDEDLMTEIGG